ncbi:GtrA family protein [Aurantimonas sp. E1-2-R+4]|uniref:GtrA family protein n=1 Tax=Aurantimonas sp. E1-2-R+4 TaxID=3113714 RepID=UPI002F944407
MRSPILYLSGQVLAYLIDIGSFYAFVLSGALEVFFANVVGKILAGIFAFFFHRVLTFQAIGQTARSIFSQGSRYASLLLGNAFLSSAVLSSLLWMSIPLLPAKIFADICTVVISYVLAQRYVFNRGR